MRHPVLGHLARRQLGQSIERSDIVIGRMLAVRVAHRLGPARQPRPPVAALRLAEDLLDRGDERPFAIATGA